MLLHLSLVLIFSFVNSGDVFIHMYNQKKHEDKKYFCITNSTSGMTWMHDFDAAKIKSEFFPRGHPEVSYSFSLPKNKKLSSVGVILDRRWEDLNVFKTYPQKPPLRKNLTSFTKEGIAFSVRIDEDAHVYLCDGNNTTTSNCYWFLLQNGNKTVLYKCEPRELSVDDNNKMCRELLQKVEHSPSFLYLSAKQWTHLSITKCNHRLVLRRVTEDTEDVFLDVEDPRQINVSFAFLYSNAVEGLWKFHQSPNETVINTPLKNAPLGPPVPTTNGSVCLSFFGLIPSGCEVQLFAKQNRKEIKKETYRGSSSSCNLRRWKEIRFVGEGIGSPKLEFYVSTSCKEASQVLVFDQPRVCRTNELRAIVAHENITCEFISKKTVSSNEENGICPENTFSRHCISCSWFASHPEQCDKVKFVEKDTKRHGCLPGYSGDDCDKTCPQGFYGHFCHQKCGRCLNGTCHHVNGTCLCVLGFTGDRCDIPPPMMFVHAPVIEIRNFTEVTISVDNFTVVNQFEDDPQEYTLQYRKNNLNESWKEMKTFYAYGKKTKIKIVNLDPNTEYLARFVIKSKSGKLHLDEHTSNFTTRCLVEHFEIQKVKTFSTNATIFITNTTCNKYQDRYWINAFLSNNTFKSKEAPTKTILIENYITSLEFNNLRPFSNYSIKLKLCDNSNRCYKEKSVSFKTNSTPPGQVQDLSAYSKNETSISLRWKQPSSKFGNLEYYQISWQIDTITIKRSPCELWPDYQCFTIPNLKKKKFYKISVTAKNEGVGKMGPWANITVRTITEPSNAPVNMTVLWTPEDDLRVSWYHPTISNGDIEFFNISFTQNQNGYREIIMPFLNVTDSLKPFYKYTISNTKVLPSSDFKVAVAAYNNHNGTETVINGSTPPSKPVLESEPKTFKMKEGTKVETSNKINSTDNTFIKTQLIVLLQNGTRKSKTRSTNFMPVIGYNRTMTGTHQNVTIDGNMLKKTSLKPDECYNVTVVVVNTFKDKSRNSSYPLKSCVQVQQNEIKTKISAFYVVYIIAAVVILGLCILLFGVRKLMQRRRKTEIFRENLCNPILNDYIDIDDAAAAPIPVNKFAEHVKTSLQSGELIRQHQKYFNAETCYERLADHLIIDSISVDLRDQYIENAYLLTKMPKFYEITSFWKTVWNESVTTIVFFDVSKKEIKYWNEPLEDISVQLVFQKNFADYEERRFILCNKGKNREVRHFRYISTFYSLSLLPFFVKISEISLCSKTPILVHSSSKIQHATFVLMCDMALRISKQYQFVDFIRICKQLLEYEVSYVSDVNLYLLAHLVVVESLQDVNSRIISPSMCVVLTELKKYSRYLKETIWIDKTDVLGAQNFMKTYSEPEKEGLIFTNNIIRGFQSKKFWVMEQPSKASTFQFWNIVKQKNISVIVGLSDDFYESACWSQIQPSKTLIFKQLDTKKFPFYDWNTTQLVINNEEVDVDLFLVKNWEPTCDCPDSIRDFVNFCIETQKVLKNTEAVLVTCSNGVTASSLYLAMIYNIEKMISEGVCDVCTAVRLMRYHNQQFIQSEAQHTFLWEAAETYLKETQFYERG